MSYVTNVIVSIGILEQTGKKALEEWDSGRYAESGSKDQFARLDKAGEGWGGSKWPEVMLFAGAFNYLDLDSFKVFLREVAWDHLGEVQLFVFDENDDKWSVFELADLARVQA